MPAGGNVGVAFALVIGAGMSTTIGASAAFFSKLTSPKALAVGLGISAGVMLYVSFVEIFMQKGLSALEDGGWSADNSYRFGTLLFFGGMVITALLDVIVHVVSGMAGKNHAEVEAGTLAGLAHKQKLSVSVEKSAVKTLALEAQSPTDSEGATPSSGKKVESSSGSEVSGSVDNVRNVLVKADKPDYDTEVVLANKPAEISDEAGAVVNEYVTADHHRFGLQKMGLMTAIAIGIHNLPEGLATFVAALADPLNGVAIAVAIALHNIPEGVCVAMPVYYATGSRWKGFWWAFLSGLSEPIGGLLGYFVLYGNRMSDLAYGILFCVVGGMMTYISIKELIPTALKYDPDNKVTSSSVFGGMVLMSASLLLFTI